MNDAQNHHAAGPQASGWGNDADYVRTVFSNLCRGDQWFQPHVERYVKTWETLTALVPNIEEKTIVDTGDTSPFWTFLKSRQEQRGIFSSGLIICTGEQELRVEYGDPLPGCPADSADVVTCLEVLEHMHDWDTTNPENRHQFTYSGMTRLLHACWHTLKPGGGMLLTTPNVHSSASFRRIAQGKCPYMYAPHVRELSEHELRSLLQQCGFGIAMFTSHDVWNRHGMSDSEAQRCSIVPSFDSDVERGDDFFVWAVRPFASK